LGKGKLICAVRLGVWVSKCRRLDRGRLLDRLWSWLIVSAGLLCLILDGGRDERSLRRLLLVTGQRLACDGPLTIDDFSNCSFSFHQIALS
jgi:hypothetical protein